MPTDILLNDDFTLAIANGDFVLGESTAQHQKILIFCDKCELKEVPMRGVASRRYLEDDQPDNLAREIRQEFSLDGQTVKEIKIAKDLTIELEAYYPGT